MKNQLVLLTLLATTITPLSQACLAKSVKTIFQMYGNTVHSDRSNPVDHNFTQTSDSLKFVKILSDDGHQKLRIIYKTGNFFSRLEWNREPISAPVKLELRFAVATPGDFSVHINYTEVGKGQCNGSFAQILPDSEYFNTQRQIIKCKATYRIAIGKKVTAYLKGDLGWNVTDSLTFGKSGKAVLRHISYTKIRNPWVGFQSEGSYQIPGSNL